MVTLTVSPASGATFSSSGAAPAADLSSCAVTMTAAKSVTATFSLVFTDATVSPGSTIVKAVHVTDLRTAVNTLRGGNGWAIQLHGCDAQRREHRGEGDPLQRAEDGARPGVPAVGLPLPTYTDPTLTPGETAVKARI